MTREEAIRELSYIADEMPSMECGDWKEAIHMAIEALQEPTTDVLEKIKAEIIARDRNVKTVRSDGRCLFTAVEVLLIIDKYKADKENEE